MTELEKRAARMKWNPPVPGSEERKEMPASAFLSPSSKTYPYKIKIDGQWVVSEKALRSVISVANFRGNSTISAKASKILEELISDEVVHSELIHFGILGMRWGVRRSQAALERKDVKWIRKKEAKIRKPLEKGAAKEMKEFARKELRTSTSLLKSGKLSKSYMNAYNQKLASLMNERVGNIQAPSGKVVRFVAKRGDIGVYTALADQGYNMSQIKKGVHASGRIAYRKAQVGVAGGGN